jgi:hypothetical protein
VCFHWSERLRFSDCDLESNDDVFCLKRAADDITLTRSRLCGRLAAAFKIGTESDGPFRSIRFSQSVIENSDRAAISIESVDGSDIRDVMIDDIELKDVNAPLLIVLGRRDRYAAGQGSIRGITLRNITGFGDAMDEGYGSCVSGLPHQPVEDIVLQGVRYTSRGGQEGALASRTVPQRPVSYPEFDMFGKLPAHGLYARSVRGLRLQGVWFDTRESDGRPPVVLEGVQETEISDGSAVDLRRTPTVEPDTPELPEGDVDALIGQLAGAEPGDTVSIAPGRYVVPREKLPLVVNKPGVTLCSEAGPDRTRLEALGAREDDAQHRSMVDPGAAMRGDPLLFVAADDVKVSGLTFSAGVYNVYLGSTARCTVAGNVFDFSKCFHVYAFGGRDHRIEGNQSRASLNSVVKLDRCRGCEVVGNTLQEDPAGVRLTESCRNVISGNRFVGLSWYGVMLERQSDDNVVAGNLFLKGRLTGVQVRGCDGTRIEGNQFRGHKTESVLVDRGSRSVVLRGNSFHDNRGLAVANETADVVDAVQNWWGSPHGPGPGAEVDSGVIVEPWLDEPTARTIAERDMGNPESA